MPTLEELTQIKAGKSFDTDSGFVAKFGATQEKVLKNFNTGVARFFGLPRLATDLLEAGENKLLNLVGIEGKTTGDKGFLPSSSDIQDFASKRNLAFKAGEEPQDLGSRIVQNIGTTAPLLPVLGPAALVPELTAATSSAVGGKIAEQTDFGKKHPDLARAIGELGGGISPGVAKGLVNFFGKGGIVGATVRTGKKGIQKGKGFLPKTKERVETRLRSIEPSPETAIKNIAREATSPEGKILTPGQASGTQGVAGLSRAVEEEIPEFAEAMAKQRISALKSLESQFKKTGDIADARAFIDAQLTQKANIANKVLSNIDTAKDPAVLSTTAENIMRSAVKKSRELESAAWNKLPSGEIAIGSNIVRVHKSALKNITEGGSLKEISDFAKEKLGVFKTIKKKVDGKTVIKSEVRGGKLFNTKKKAASAKAIHQFYSQLGRERDVLSRQAGSSNKIRIIDDLRDAALKDLDEAGLSAPYTDAIKLSRELNQKFTRGSVGRVLGFSRGETPNPTRLLDELIGKGGRQGKEAIQQALRGAPDVKNDIEDFIRVQFGIAATDSKFNTINAVAGNKFIKNFDEILTDVFPGLKSELQDAITKQVDVDKFIGVPQTSRLSPLIKDKTAASIFLKANPGEEMSKIINSTSIQKADVLTDLVKLVKQDSTGKALSGLKHGFAEEVFEFGRKGDVVSGKRIIEKINKLKPAILKSGLFDKEEVKGFVRIGDAFEKIAFELGTKAIKGGIISDVPSRVLSTSLRVLAVRLTGKLNRIVNKFSGSGDFGGSIQTANIASNEAVRFAKGLTNDEARNILIKAVKDKDLMTVLLKDISKISTDQRQGVFSAIKSKLDELRSLTPSQVVKRVGSVAGKVAKKTGIERPRAGAVLPAVASVGRSRESEKSRKSKIDILKKLQASKVGK